MIKYQAERIYLAADVEIGSRLTEAKPDSLPPQFGFESELNGARQSEDPTAFLSLIGVAVKERGGVV